MSRYGSAVHEGLPSLYCGARDSSRTVLHEAGRGLGQYVILGAGLDTFAQRRSDLASRLTVFEVDRPGPQAWKRQRLIELGYGIPEWLNLVPVDFEAGGSWWAELAAASALASRYFAGRTDGHRPPNNAEELLVART